MIRNNFEARTARQVRTMIPLVNQSITGKQTQVRLIQSGHPRQPYEAMREVFNFSIAQKLPILVCDDDDKRGELIREFINNVEFYENTLAENGEPILVTFRAEQNKLIPTGGGDIKHAPKKVYYTGVENGLNTVFDRQGLALLR